MVRIKSNQTLEVEWARELYKITKVIHSQPYSCRECWVCGYPFEIGDGLTVAHSVNRGNRLMHSRCYERAGGKTT